MPKVVINRSFGGFGLSDAGYRRYAEIKGLTLYPELSRGQTTWWVVPPDQRPDELSGAAWRAATEEERKANRALCDAAEIYSNDMDRRDLVLVQVVEELGLVADGPYAKLAVVDVPDDVEWHIDEYDGREHIAENHRTW